MLQWSRIRGVLALGAILVLAVLASGCAGAARTSSQAAPGQGSTMADQLYKVIKPVPGEQISIAKVDNADTDTHQYLLDRFQSAKDSNPALFVGIQYSSSADGDMYTFQDGSTMLWVPKPSSDGASALLDHVEITRR